ncbi:MAG: DUF378 domain-containing protein [Clostridia bacterium]
MKIINVIALALVIVGALNWGMIALFGIDLVATLFGGSATIFSRIVYALVALCGLWSLTLFTKVSSED